METRRPNGWAGLSRFGGIGDDLIVAVALPGLKKKYGHVEVITGGDQAIVFENNPYIDKLSVTAKDSIPNPNPEEWQAWFKRRSAEYDFFIHLSHSCETLRALLPTQTQFWWPAEWRRKFCGHNYLETVLDICGLPHEFGPLFFPTDDEKSQAQETKKKVGEKVIGWVISGTRVDKFHPYAPQAIARLIREVGPVVMLGAPMSKNLETAKAIQADVLKINSTDAGLHLALSSDEKNPNWPVRRILTFAQACDVVISPDTGPAWAVAFEPNQKIIMLSHASQTNITRHWTNTTTLHADQTRVPCWPCHQLHNSGETCTPNKEGTASACISDISVETIVMTAARLMEKPSGKYRKLQRIAAAKLQSQHGNGHAPDSVGDRSVAGGAV